MKCIPTEVKDVFIIEPDKFGDHRGWFMESWSKRKMEEAGLFYDFIQDNHSYSTVKGTIRGLHCQNGASSQAKLVRCTKGKVLDVAVDVRKDSPTYMKWAAVELSPDNNRQFMIPRGCLHGFLTLTDEVEFLYKADNYYDPASDRSVRFDDPAFGIDWGIANPILSDKDLNAPLYKDTDINF